MLVGALPVTYTQADRHHLRAKWLGPGRTFPAGELLERRPGPSRLLTAPYRPGHF
jgi:hypothetical protein